MERDIYGRFRSSRREEPEWMGVATVVSWVAGTWLLFGWIAGVTMAVGIALIFAMCEWLSRRHRK